MNSKSRPDAFFRQIGSLQQLVRLFERNFRKAFGTSPHQYLVGIRVDHACRLLIETDDTMTVVAQRCGFYDHAHFTRAFAALMGTGPSGYRRDHQQPAL